MSKCEICPRGCKADRDLGSIGYCGESDLIRVARIAPHLFEEPPISGSRGSGTVFFSGCSLHCVFCQNKKISRTDGVGRVISQEELKDAILRLQDEGVHNINLVTPTHFAHRIAEVISGIKTTGELRIPVIYNSSGYEKVDTLKRLEGLVDIYMPDFKYYSTELSSRYSSAPDYMTVATEALKEMYRQVGSFKYGNDGMLSRGLVVRHLVLPGNRHDSIAVLEHLASFLPTENILLSLMSQYTPEFAMDCDFKELHRRVTSFEYSSVVKRAEELGFDGFIQSKESATSEFTPNFK